MTTQIPKMRINKFQQVTALPKVDELGPYRLIDRTRLTLAVHQEEGGDKHFVLRSTFQIYGWTTDANKAFQATGNLCVYNANELYEALRGRPPA